MAEFWDLYNENKEPLNQRHKRGEPLPEGKYHLVVDILSVNPYGKILITKRHPDKHYGGMWEISGGSVIAGETPLEGAKRELFEETGLADYKIYSSSALSDDSSVSLVAASFSSEELEKIMEPFYMIDKSRSRKNGGAGLGLALSAAILRRHNVKFSIESRLGEGTIVNLQFV